jgi:hypothetical protein
MKLSHFWEIANQIWKLPTFLEPEGSLPCSQEVAIGPYFKPVESGQHAYPISFDRLQ